LLNYYSHKSLSRETIIGNLGKNGVIPCGPNAYCEPEGHTAWCKCLPGYTTGKNEQCVSDCDGTLCGSNAQCISSNAGPTCKCLDGFMGNPFAGGQCVPEVCSPFNPCQDPMICDAGKCKEKCGDVVCGVGAICDVSTNRCVCPPFHVGNPDYKCVPRKLFLFEVEQLHYICVNITRYLLSSFSPIWT